eukprot:XP_001703452.1 hypothetical protein CHLREDRAFT_168966 [Chlamydomonas reinhardtii]
MSKDTRRVQKLAPVVTVDELRKTGVLGARHTITSSLAYPGLTAKSLWEPPDAGAGSGGDADDSASDSPSAASGAARGSPAAAKGPVRMASPDQCSHLCLLTQYDATAAARSTLIHERPNVVERMEKGVAVCGVLRDNRHYRLNSLGVFHAGVNDVRTRSMHRVELHKHLSSTNLRAPQGDKEVRSAVQQDNVGTRLEKMYNRVLKSQYLTDDPGRGKAQGSVLLTPSHATARSGGGGTMNSPTHAARSGGGAGMPQSPSMLVRHGSPGPGGAGSPGPGLGSSQQLPNPFAGGPGAGNTTSPNAQQQRDLGGTSKGTARSADYWVKVTLPPEVIEAQLRHLAATTEANLRAYHARVAAAQDELLHSSGLGPETLGLNPEQVEQSLKVKLGQIQEDTTANDFNYSSLSREAVLASRLGAASKQLLTATSLPQFIRAALEHVTQHSSELQQLAEPDRAKAEHGMGRTITIMRRPDAMITEDWMEEFRDQLLEIESSPVAPHSPPDGIQPLPPLGAGDMDAGAYVRSRLERLWGVLGMPPHTRLDMVLFFTSRDRALTFAGSLELWEAAAAAVLSRESQVEALVSVQHEIESNNADRLSLGALSALCVRVLQQTRWVAALSERLRQDNGWELTFNGQPYPGPDAISSTHLVAFMEMLRQATEVTGLRP